MLTHQDRCMYMLPLSYLLSFSYVYLELHSCFSYTHLLASTDKSQEQGGQGRLITLTDKQISIRKIVPTLNEFPTH